MNHCRSVHPSRRLAVLTRDDDDLPSTQTASDSKHDDDSSQRPEGGSKTHDLSNLRNISRPIAFELHTKRAKSTGNATYEEKNKSMSSEPSSEYLSTKDDARDDSLEESDTDTEGYESSDEYEPPSSKKKSATARRGQPRDETGFDRSATAQRSDSESGTGNDNDSRNENVEDDQRDDPACDHIPCETIFAINRTTFRPRWWSQTPTPSDHEDSSSRQSASSSNLPSTVKVKTEPVDDYEQQSALSVGASVPASNTSAPDRRRELLFRAPVGTNQPTQRQYYCMYCGLTSKWNRRDIRLHVLHVHVGIRAFTCGHCGFGNSRNRAVVRSHCVKSHPGRQLLVVDNEPLFEAVHSVQDRDNLEAIAFTASDGTPLLTVEELDEYLSAKGIRFRTPTPIRKTSEPRVALPTPETARETIRISLSNQGQPSIKPGEKQSSEMSSESPDASELVISKKQMDRLNCQWKCRQCNYTDSSIAELEIHIVKDHLQLELHSCPHCHKYFSESQNVLSHIVADHADGERRSVSTVDEKAKYIHRNVECVSVDVESSSPNPRGGFHVDHAGTGQFGSGDACDEKSNRKDSETAGDAAGVPRESYDEERINSVQSSRQTEPLETGGPPPAVENPVTEEGPLSSFSTDILSSRQEELHVSKDVSQFVSRDSAVREENVRNELRSNGRVIQSLGDDSELHLLTGENSGGDQPDMGDEPTRSVICTVTRLDHNGSDTLPTSVEEQDSPKDLPQNEKHGKPPRDLSVPSAASDMNENEEDVGELRIVHVQHIDADAFSMLAEDQGDLSRSEKRTERPSDAAVLSTGPNNIPNDGRNDASPALSEAELSQRDLSRTTEHTQQFADIALPPAESDITRNEANCDVTGHVKRVVADEFPMLTADQRPFRDLSRSNDCTQRPVDVSSQLSTSDTSTDEENDEIWKNSHEEETIVEIGPVSAQQESKSPPEETVKPFNICPPPLVETNTGTVHEGRNSSREEHPLPSSDVVVTSSTTVVVHSPPVNAVGPPCNGLIEDSATASPREHLEKNLDPVKDAAIRPSLTEQERRNDSTEKLGDKPTDTGARELNSEGREPNINPANDDFRGATVREPRSSRLSEDEDDEPSGRSSLSSSTSTWRCDDCSFVGASESLLVAHQRSRQQYRCGHCPDFLHSSVVHLRHHCLTRHPGKPISYKHTVLPCSDIKSTMSSSNSSRVPVSSDQIVTSKTVTKPENAEPNNSGDSKSDEAYCPDVEEDFSSSAEESDNSEDEDWGEPVPKKKSKVIRKSPSNASKNAAESTAGSTSGTLVCDLCSSYTTPNPTVMRHHIMSHLQYYPYFCPHCKLFRSVRSFPIIKHIRIKHQGKSERFECNPDPETEKKVKKSFHRANSDEKVRGEAAAAICNPLPPQPMEDKPASSSKPEEREQATVSALTTVGNKNRKILYKCKICGLKTHLRGDFRHHIMRELQYKPFK